MAVTLYSWSDASAPAVLNAGAGTGSLLAVLDACLVTGYGAKPAAGWTKPFVNAGNIGVYRNATTGSGTGTYFRIDDSATHYSNLVGYEGMTDLNTGTFRFPTTAQITNGVILRKLLMASVVDATNDGKWYIVADEHFAHIFIQIGTPISTYGNFYGSMGDTISLAANDTFRAMVAGDITSTGTSAYSTTIDQATLNTTTPGTYMTRDITGLTTSIACGIQANMGLCDGKLGYGPGYNLVFPNPIDGNLIISNVFVTHTSPGVVRAMIPGLKAPCHRTPFSNLMVHVGDGDLAGKTFLAMSVGGSTASRGQVLVETSNTWYA